MNRPPPDIEPLDLVEHAPGRWGTRPAAPATGRTERGLNWLAGFLAGVIVGMVIGSALPARAETWPAGSIAVIDGDTVRLPSGEVVRLWAIDAPETARAKCEREAALGWLATERLGQLLRRGPATLTRCEPAKGNAAPRCRDRFGRTLGALGIDGQDAGEILIREGLATRWPTRPDLCRP
jgi:endonuclease YncB( thermonuclease family)